MTIMVPWRENSMPDSTIHWKDLIVQQGQTTLMPDVAARVAADLDDDLEYLRTNASFIFEDQPLDVQGKAAGNLVRGWQAGGRTPSLAALCIYAVQNRKMKLSPEMSRSLMAAVLLGEEKSTLAYHNNTHFKKVLLQAIRLGQADGTLEDDRFSLLMIAACVHDYHHDGAGNIVNGIHRQALNETESFNAVAPKLESAGLSEKFLRDLKVMLLTTDVSASVSKRSYASKMKAMHRYHHKKDADHVLLPKDLEILQTRPDLVHLCLLLHEADIATSAGMALDITVHEALLVAQEARHASIPPAEILKFMNAVCGGKFLSEAGQRLYGGNMASIMALLEKEKSKGNKPYMVKNITTGLEGSPSVSH